MIDVSAVRHLHEETVVRWHQQPLDNTYEGVLSVICQQHQFNYLLWHQEDIARSRDVSDQRIAEVKRAIDAYNQQRNDWIEKIDDWLTVQLTAQQITPASSATMNTETPGSVIDRLSILALRIYHLNEQLERADVGPEHLSKVRQKMAICGHQQHDLSLAFCELIADIMAGRKVHKTYRQFKMYNDPTLNPYLYGRAAARKAG